MERKVNNATEAGQRKYNLTARQVKALKAVYGNSWVKLSKKAIDASLSTLGE